MPQALPQLAGTLALEVLGIVGAIWLIAMLLSGRGSLQRDGRRVAAAIVSVFVLAFCVGSVADAGSVLWAAGSRPSSPRRGLERCFDELNAGGHLRFMNWVKSQLRHDSLYALDFAGQPDQWCLALVLLPALPYRGRQHPDYTIAFGAIPPDVAARIARHDQTVTVYAPGYALAKDAPG
jgi:hypothetical protein